MLFSLSAAVLHAEDTVTVHVWDRANVGAEAMTQALRTAKAIFRDAEVKLEFLRCPDECSGRSIGPTDIFVRIDGGKKPKWLSPAALGFATPGGERVVVIRYPRIKEESLAELAELGALIGATIAHELGHVLIGNGQHSQLGVMKAYWNRADMTSACMGRLLFLPWEVQTIHQNLVHTGTTGP